MSDSVFLSRPLSRRRLLQTGALAGLAGLAGHQLLPNRAQAAGASFTTIEPGFLTVATLGELPATGVEDGKLVGFDGVIISAIAERLNLTVKPALQGLAGTVDAVRSRRADVTLGNLRWGARRAEVLALTDAIYHISYGLIGRNDETLPSNITLADLKGRRIGTLNGASSTAELKAIPETESVQFYENTDSTLRDILAGRLDFAVLDPTVVSYALSKKSDLNLRHFLLEYNPDFPLVTGKAEVVLGLSLENQPLYDAINAGVKWVWQQGINKAALAQYGITSEDYLVPSETNVRLGVDRDEQGNVIGPNAHDPADFSSYFS